MKDLTKLLSHLPENKVEELERITQRIVGTGKAEIVVLFGSYARGDYKEKKDLSPILKHGEKNEIKF